MSRKVFFAYFMCTLILCGCGRKAAEPTPVRVVTQITVTRHAGGEVTRQIYTDPEKLHKILTAIRQLGQKFTPSTDPTALPQESFHIQLHQTDGTTQLYRTKADRYIRQDHHPWQETDPKTLTQLTDLLRNLTGDTPAQKTLSSRGRILAPRIYEGGWRAAPGGSPKNAVIARAQPVAIPPPIMLSLRASPQTGCGNPPVFPPPS